jgi:hypothetical protein
VGSTDLRPSFFFSVDIDILKFTLWTIIHASHILVCCIFSFVHLKEFSNFPFDFFLVPLAIFTNVLFSHICEFSKFPSVIDYLFSTTPGLFGSLSSCPLSLHTLFVTVFYKAQLLCSPSLGSLNKKAEEMSSPSDVLQRSTCHVVPKTKSFFFYTAGKNDQQTSGLYS